MPDRCKIFTQQFRFFQKRISQEHSAQNRHDDKRQYFISIQNKIQQSKYKHRWNNQIGRQQQAVCKRFDDQLFPGIGKHFVSERDEHDIIIGYSGEQNACSNTLKWCPEKAARIDGEQSRTIEKIFLFRLLISNPFTRITPSASRPEIWKGNAINIR